MPLSSTGRGHDLPGSVRWMAGYVSRPDLSTAHALTGAQRRHRNSPEGWRTLPPGWAACSQSTEHEATLGSRSGCVVALGTTEKHQHLGNFFALTEPPLPWLVEPTVLREFGHGGYLPRPDESQRGRRDATPGERLIITAKECSSVPKRIGQLWRPRGCPGSAKVYSDRHRSCWKADSRDCQARPYLTGDSEVLAVTAMV